jgi:hypothetical protein
MFLFQDQAQSPSIPPMMNNPIADTRERVPQTLSKEVQEKLKEIFAWLQRDARDQFKILITLKKCLNPSAENFLRTSMPHLNPSPVWIFITCP